MLVFINITMCFRHIFHTIDFIPSVPFSNKAGGVKSEHIDIVYYETIKPYIQEILNKLNLYTEILLEIDTYTIIAPWNTPNLLYIVVPYTRIIDKENSFPKSSKVTNFYPKYREKILTKNQLTDGTFILSELDRNIEHLEDGKIFVSDLIPDNI